MLYKFRKIFVLALCLAMVFGLSVTAFAANTFHEIIDYSDGRTTVESYANITRYTTNGLIESSCVFCDTSTTITVSGRYIDCDRNEQTYSSMDSALNGSMVLVRFNPIDGINVGNKIFAFVDGNYYFRASVYTYEGYEYYERWATVTY